MERLNAANDRAPRPLRLLYNFPFEHDRLAASHGLRMLDVSPSEWPPRQNWWLKSEVIVTYGIGGGPFTPPRGRRRQTHVLRQWTGLNDVGFALERPGQAAIRSAVPPALT